MASILIVVLERISAVQQPHVGDEADITLLHGGSNLVLTRCEVHRIERLRLSLGQPGNSVRSWIVRGVANE